MDDETIKTCLEKIMTAVYGEEVRGSIHDAIEKISQNLDKEQAERKSEDQTLQESITSEIQNRTSGDSTLERKITGETSARESADSSLQKAIDDEKTAREKADDALRAAIASGGEGAGAVIAEITIPSDGWSEDGESRYIDVEVVGALQNGFPLVSIHADSIQTAAEAGLYSSAEALDGSIRFRAVEQTGSAIKATAAIIL